MGMRPASACCVPIMKPCEISGSAINSSSPPMPGTSSITMAASMKVANSPAKPSGLPEKMRKPLRAQSTPRLAGTFNSFMACGAAGHPVQ